MPENAPLRVIIVGAGNMGRQWLKIAEESPAYEVVGVVDTYLEGARTVVSQLGYDRLPVTATLAEMLALVKADVVANVTIPAAHYEITKMALLNGMPVVSEKPAAATLAESMALAAASEITGCLFAVSQSRRHNEQLHDLKHRASTLGRVGIATTEFFRAPHFGGFRDEMEHPLLVDMAIHPFDSARFLLEADPVAVYCEEYNPPWSWYKGGAAVTAIFEMTGSTRYIYTGSWASAGRETSWNGVWRLSTEGGTAVWTGDDTPTSEPETESSERSVHYGGVSESLHSFADAISTGSPFSGEIHENLLSLAMVEAAVISSETRVRVNIDDVLEDARLKAISVETDVDVRTALNNWGRAGDYLRLRAQASKPAFAGSKSAN